jgi:hypothetical protein
MSLSTQEIRDRSADITLADLSNLVDTGTLEQIKKTERVVDPILSQLSENIGGPLCTILTHLAEMAEEPQPLKMYPTNYRLEILSEIAKISTALSSIDGFSRKQPLDAALSQATDAFLFKRIPKTEEIPTILQAINAISSEEERASTRRHIVDQAISAAKEKKAHSGYGGGRSISTQEIRMQSYNSDEGFKFTATLMVQAKDFPKAFEAAGLIENFDKRRLVFGNVTNALIEEVGISNATDFDFSALSPENIDEALLPIFYHWKNQGNDIKAREVANRVSQEELRKCFLSQCR